MSMITEGAEMRMDGGGGGGGNLRGDRFGGKTVGDAAKHVCGACLHVGLCPLCDDLI